MYVITAYLLASSQPSRPRRREGVRVNNTIRKSLGWWGGSTAHTHARHTSGCTCVLEPISTSLHDYFPTSFCFLALRPRAAASRHWHGGLTLRSRCGVAPRFGPGAAPHTRAISATALDDRGYGGAGAARDTGEVLKRRCSPSFRAKRAGTWCDNFPPTRAPLPVPTCLRRRRPPQTPRRSFDLPHAAMTTDRPPDRLHRF